MEKVSFKSNHTGNLAITGLCVVAPGETVTVDKDKLEKAATDVVKSWFDAGILEPVKQEAKPNTGKTAEKPQAKAPEKSADKSDPAADASAKG